MPCGSGAWSPPWPSSGWARDPGGLAYEKGAASRCAKCGIDLRRIHLDDAASLPEVTDP